MGDYVPISLSIITLLFGLIFGAWLKMLVGRTFKSIDDSISHLASSLSKEKEKTARFNDWSIHVDETLKSLDCVRHYRDDLLKLQKDTLTDLSGFQKKSDYIREMDQVTNQLEATCQKIDELDKKFWNLKDQIYESKMKKEQ